MIREFRIKILAFEYNEQIHGKREKCIQFQLQKLFARLQLKFLQTEKTDGLTNSFNWGYTELSEQHDIQELCRILFDILNDKSDWINELFGGLLSSVVECSECKNKSERVDSFLDIPLPVISECT